MLVCSEQLIISNLVNDTLKALELGAVEMLLVWESLEMLRLELRNNQTSEVTVLHINPDQVNNLSSSATLYFLH